MLKWMTDGRPVKSVIPIAVGERSIAFPRRSVKAGVNKARNLCPNPGKQLIPGQPAGEHDVQADAVRQNAAVVFFQFADDGQNGIAFASLPAPSFRVKASFATFCISVVI